MCGIAGVLSRDEALLNCIQVMVDVQTHRGPDGAGYLLMGEAARLSHAKAPEALSSDFLALGHRRLAIIDCTDAGAQPMSSVEGGDWISYNGEIYNYLELRDELEAAGHTFTTDSDTEVVLCAYQAWGTDCFKRFNGMWAMALWDGQRGRLVLSRDRLGVKPLYYSNVSDGLVFASEIKAILSTERIKPRLNLQVAMDFLKWSIVNHRDDSFFKDVHALPAGCFAIVDETRSVVPQSYWSLSCEADQFVADSEHAEAKFAELFRGAVALRLRSDVPVGSCLSGGLDSSAIVCQAQDLRVSKHEPIQTFSASSDDPRFDERKWCQIVNDTVGAASHYVFPSGEGFRRDLDDLIWHQEEPFTSASIYAQWSVMSAARESGVPVLLDGQGADEGLCGYRKFYLFYLRELASSGRWIRAIREGISLILRGDRGLLRWREGVRYLPKLLRSRLPSIADYLTPAGLSAWDTSALQLGGGRSVRDRQIQDMTRLSVPSLLRYEDRNSMAWSIESRVPFLDYRLVEWLVCLPTSLKLSRGRTKALMRDSLRGLVPNAILDRRDKMGFGTAQEEWMRTSLSQEIEQCFSAKNFPLAKIVEQSALINAFNLWQKGESVLPQQEFFRLFILARWMRCFNVKVD